MCLFPVGSLGSIGAEGGSHLIGALAPLQAPTTPPLGCSCLLGLWLEVFLDRVVLPCLLSWMSEI